MKRMSYVLLRKDLTETTRKCWFCSKSLTSLKAYVLRNCITGDEVYAGPKCTKKHIASEHDFSEIPDLTRFTVGDEASGATKEGSKRGHSPTHDSHKKWAMEYLILREEKLSEELKCSYSVLKKYLMKSREIGLTSEDVRHVNNIEAKAPEELRLENLQRCYNYLFWIDKALKALPEEKREFLQGVRTTLVKKKCIKPKQKEGTNKWLRNIPGLPQLR